MNILRRSIRNSLLAVVPMILLVSCGGSTAEKEVPVITKMTLAITDAPVDNASIVNVRFTGVEIQPVSGDRLTVNFPVDSPKNIDLLALNGGGSEIIKGTFDKKYLEDEMGEMIDIIVPVIEVNDADGNKIKKTTQIKFNGLLYQVLRKRPVDTGKTQVILRLD